MVTYEPTFEDSSGRPVKFPFNRQPCLKPNENYLIHFISSNDTWYGFIFGGTGDFYCNEIQNYSPAILSTLRFYSGITGACCTGLTCEITNYSECSGYFYGAGSTCGIGTTGNCFSELGSCCVNNTINGSNVTQCFENISASDCYKMKRDSVVTIFSGPGKTCLDMNCSSISKNEGPCCDGKGNCKQLTEEDCIVSGGSFLGIGLNCFSRGNNPVCAGGTGACCSSIGGCTYTSAINCFEDGGYFQGVGTECLGVTCSSQLKCCSFLNYTLKPGDLFGGGVVVGVFNPYESRVLGGKHAFSKKGITSSFMNGGETTCNYFTTEPDYIGYGTEGETCVSLKNNKSDSYYIVVSLHPAAIDKNGNSINPINEQPKQDTFNWYGSGIAWGPLLSLTNYTFSDFTYLDKTYETYYLAYGEGYYGITGETLDNIKSVTFQNCGATRKNGLDPVARIFAKSPKSSNGFWRRNWGLYNTIRMLSADNANTIGITGSAFKTDDFELGDEYNSLYALKLFDNNSFENNKGITQNPKELSDWYLPSHDELAFIAANCISDITNEYLGFNLNTALLQNDGMPLYGWHWSSTGSFDTNNIVEGVYTNQKPKHGTVAWSIYFDINGSAENFLVKKEDRSKQLKVRPIRAIRCDGVIPDQNIDAYKLWKTPPLLRNIR